MLRGFQFLLIVLMLAVLAMISAVVTMHFAIHGAEVAVPDFKDLAIAEATSKAASMGLNVNVENQFYSVDIPAGRVANQSPAPGTVVRSEWSVRLTESLGPQKVAIPNLIGAQQRLASIEIRRDGLEPGQGAEMPDAYAAPDTVIAQNPKPNASGVERPSVSLLVAAPAPDTDAGFVMPDFTGQVFSSAAYAITHAGLQLAPLKEQAVPIAPIDSFNPARPSAPVAVGSVIAQSPAPGAHVDAATQIQLTVAQ